MSKRLTRQRSAAAIAIGACVGASLLTGWRWRVTVDSGGASAGNPISHYGPHWLYPVIASIVLAGLLITVTRRVLPLGMAVSLIAFAAGAAGNVAQWVVLGGVSNPIGPLPGIHGNGYASIGDACLWLGALAGIGQALVTRTASARTRRTPSPGRR